MQKSVRMMFRWLALLVLLRPSTSQSVPTNSNGALTGTDISGGPQTKDPTGIGDRGTAASPSYTRPDADVPGNYDDFPSLVEEASRYVPDAQLNSADFEKVIDNMTQILDARDKSGDTLCMLRNVLETKYFNFTTEDGGRYCRAYFDEIRCWPESLPGVVELPCPSTFRGIEYSTNHTVTRFCHGNGSWGNDNRSDYSECQPIINVVETAPHERHEYHISLINISGSALSFSATLVALIILVAFRSLWCMRNYIHMNFLLSFLLLYIVLFVIVIRGRFRGLEASPWEFCILRAGALAVTVANFCWMLVEGIYLYFTLVRGSIVKIRTLWLYAGIGWVIPIILTGVNVIVQYMLYWDKDKLEDTCLEENYTDYIITVPIMIIILINVFFLVHIIIVIIRRPRPTVESENIRQLKEAIRALVVLTPLLGAAYLLFIVKPSPEDQTTATHVYHYLLSILQATQGFFVALIYVFLNREVHKVLRRRCCSFAESDTVYTSVTRRGSKQRPSNGAIPLQVTSSDGTHESHQANGKPPKEDALQVNHAGQQINGGTATLAAAAAAAASSPYAHSSIPEEEEPLQPQSDREETGRADLRNSVSREDDEFEVDIQSSLLARDEDPGKFEGKVDHKAIIDNNNCRFVVQT